MIIFLNKKKDKEFTYFMLITGMKQKVFFQKKKLQVQICRAVVSSRTELSSICGLVEG